MIFHMEKFVSRNATRGNSVIGRILYQALIIPFVVIMLSGDALAVPHKSFLKCFNDPAACEQPSLEADRRERERERNRANINKSAVKSDRPYDFAVIIGNQTYQGRIPEVEFAHNDADAMKNLIIRRMGLSPDNIIDLREVTSAKIESVFGNHRTHEGKLWRDIDPEGRSNVTVFYSGHGVPGLKDQQSYLLPVDADPEAPEMNGFPLKVMLENLEKLNVRSVTVFIDACFSGQTQKGYLIKSASGMILKPKMPEGPFTRMTVLAAAKSDQVASWDENSEHGLFTRHLLDALYGAADAGDTGNNDQKVTLNEVQSYLDKYMTSAARKMYGRHQKAWIRGDGNRVLIELESKK